MGFAVIVFESAKRIEKMIFQAFLFSKTRVFTLELT